MVHRLVAHSALGHIRGSLIVQKKKKRPLSTIGLVEYEYWLGTEKNAFPGIAFLSGYFAKGLLQQPRVGLSASRKDQVKAHTKGQVQ